MKTAHDLVLAAKTRVKEIDLTQADQALRDGAVLIDVREESEFAAGHIPGAVHASRGMLEFKLSTNPALQPRDLKVVLYCKTGGRAALAAVAMLDMGYLDVMSVAGGIDAWATQGRPVARPEQPSFE
jgi:rhodanese-related sulfurtransferase